jgi:polyphosphate kinase
MNSPKPYFNRDLSWLSFNYRVLLEAKDPKVPLADRIKFLAIFSSNLDEFFRVRVASLRRLSSIRHKKMGTVLDFEPKQVLDEILQVVDKHQREYGTIFSRKLLPELKKHGIILYYNQPLPEVHRDEVSRFFKSKVLSYLQPVFLQQFTGEAFSHKALNLSSRTLYFAISLRRKKPEPEEGIRYACVNIPFNNLSRFVSLSPVKGKSCFIFLDDVIRENLPFIFPGYEILGCYSFRFNRAEDISIEDEYVGDLVAKVRTQLIKRRTAPPIRFLYDASTPPEFLDLFTRLFELKKSDLVSGGRYHKLSDLMKLPLNQPGLETPSYPDLAILPLEKSESMFEAIEEQDRIMHFPYQSYDYVLRFFNEAAIDPNVYEIKVAIYRIASNSFIANALISAARNGKKVTVFVEVKARFDEANNLRWAEEMEKAGIHIIYSIPGVKVHAKIALVRRHNPLGNPDDKPLKYGYFGTGNFNEVTADIYADHSLFTCHEGMVKDLEKVFRYLKKKKEITQLKHLLVAPFNLQQTYLSLIDREIAFARRGEPARLIVKLNGLEDRVMIDKLYEASQAGVQVDLIIRGICCLLPGVSGLSENIRVIRLVDIFLEHARVAIFHNGGNEEMFLASADWMNRNLYRRVEVGFPIYDADARSEIRQIIEFQLKDNVKACSLDAAQTNHPVGAANEPAVRAQTDTYQWLKDKEEITPLPLAATVKG